MKKKIIYLVIFLICVILASLLNKDFNLIHVFKKFFIDTPKNIFLFSGKVNSNVIVAYGYIISESLISIIRSLVSFLIGIFVGLIASFSFFLSFQGKRTTNINLVLLKNIPLFGLIPLFLYWFGDKGIGIYVYIIFCVAVNIGISSYEALINLENNYVKILKIYNKNKIKRAINLLPGILPELASSIEFVVQLLLAFTLGAEFISAQNGLGYLTYLSYLYSKTSNLIFIALVYILISTLLLKVTKKIIAIKLVWN